MVRPLRVKQAHTQHRSARHCNPLRLDFGSLHIIQRLRLRRWLPSHSTAAVPALVEQAADTAEEEVPVAEPEAAARVVVELAAARAGLAAVPAAEQAEARVEPEVAREPAGLRSVVRIATLLTIRRGRSFRNFLRLRPPISR